MTKLKLVANYQMVRARWAPLAAETAAALEIIRRSYDQNGDPEERRHAANEVLDQLLENYDQNGFSNSWARLALAHMMLDLLPPVGQRTGEVTGHILDAYIKAEADIPSHLQHRLDTVMKRQREYKRAA